ncbi:MAG: efflux RND transporter periplasmic adaptor subunit [Planctomycetota bacterium]
MSQIPQLDLPPDGHSPASSQDIDESLQGSTSPTSIPSNRSDSPAWRTWGYRIVSFVLTASAVGLAVWTRERWEPALDAWIRPPASDPRKTRPAPLVTIASAKKESVSQFINCLGTVTAFNSVSVKSRVDGELVDVAFREGQMVEAGQLLARIDPRGFEAARDQTQGQLQRDLAALELARLNFERSKNLTSETSLSQQERDEFDAIYKQAQAVVDVDRAALANTELQVTYTKITSPIGGRVGLRLVDQGNMVKASDPNGIAVITQLKPISIVFPIPQDEIPRVQKQLAASKSVPVFAYDRSFKEQLAEGTLTAIDNQVDATTGTLRLKATFENEAENLFPNQFVNVRLLVKQWEDSIVIPSTAIQRGADFLYVYVVGDDSTVDVARVDVAFSEAGRTVVASGLSEGQLVVTEGTDKLQPKGKVTLPGASKESAPREGNTKEAGQRSESKSGEENKHPHGPAQRPDSQRAG